jgi:hypothetical protein
MAKIRAIFGDSPGVLILANPMQQLDAGNRDYRMSDVLQSQRRPHTQFYPRGDES